jgi:phenylalanyl-tRNA synthetase alpha chain
MKNHLEQLVFAVFGQKLESRWIDGYFPFTDPSWELEIFWNNQWLEVLGCGVIRQEILEKSGVVDHKGWAFGIGLERLAMVLFKIPDIRLFWSNDQRFLGQFSEGKINHFKSFSSFPPCLKDIAFWVPPTFHENDFCEFVRGTAGDLVENVTLIDSFKHPKTGRESRCYRLTYRSMERNLTNEEIDILQNKLRELVPSTLGVELR